MWYNGLVCGTVRVVSVVLYLVYGTVSCERGFMCGTVHVVMLLSCVIQRFSVWYCVVSCVVHGMAGGTVF